MHSFFDVALSDLFEKSGPCVPSDPKLLNLLPYFGIALPEKESLESVNRYVERLRIRIPHIVMDIHKSPVLTEQERGCFSRFHTNDFVQNSNLLCDLLNMAYEHCVVLPFRGKRINGVPLLPEERSLEEKAQIIRAWLQAEGRDTEEIWASRMSCYPEELCHLNELRTLTLASSPISVFPDSIQGLVNLSHLSLSFDHLDGFPEALRHLPQLTRLNFSYNEILHDFDGGMYPFYVNDLFAMKHRNPRVCSPDGESMVEGDIQVRAWLEDNVLGCEFSISFGAPSVGWSHPVLPPDVPLDPLSYTPCVTA